MCNGIYEASCETLRSAIVRDLWLQLHGIIQKMFIFYPLFNISGSELSISATLSAVIQTQCLQYASILRHTLYRVTAVVQRTRRGDGRQ